MHIYVYKHTYITQISVERIQIEYHGEERTDGTDK